MKTLLCLFLTCLSCAASTVQFYTTNSLGQPDTNYFRVIPIQDPVLANGAIITKGVAIRCYPNTNGFFSTNFVVGNYQMTNQFLGNGILFFVPNDTNTYSVTDIAISGFNTFRPTGVRQLTSANKSVVLNPPNGTGIVDLFVAAGGQATNTIDIGPGTNIFILTNGLLRTIGGVTDTNVVNILATNVANAGFVHRSGDTMTGALTNQQFQITAGGAFNVEEPNLSSIFTIDSSGDIFFLNPDGGSVLTYSAGTSAANDILSLGTRRGTVFRANSSETDVYDQSNHIGISIVAQADASKLITFPASSYLNQIGGKSNYFSGDISSPNFWGRFHGTADASINSTNFWGQLSPTNYNNGTGASVSTFLRGDGTWDAIAAFATVVAAGSNTLVTLVSASGTNTYTVYGLTDTNVVNILASVIALTATNQLAISDTNQWDPKGAALTATNQLAIVLSNAYIASLSGNGTNVTLWVTRTGSFSVNELDGTPIFRWTPSSANSLDGITISRTNDLVLTATDLGTIVYDQSNNVGVTFIQQANATEFATFPGGASWAAGKTFIDPVTGKLTVPEIDFATLVGSTLEFTNLVGYVQATNLAAGGSAGLFLGWVSASNQVAWLPVGTATFVSGNSVPLTNSFNSTNNVSHYGFYETNDTTHSFELLTNGSLYISNAVTGAWQQRTNDSITTSNLQGGYFGYTNLGLFITNRTAANTGSLLTSTNLQITTGSPGSNTLYDANGTSVIMTLTNGGGFAANDFEFGGFVRGVAGGVSLYENRAYWQTNNFPLAAGAINLDWRAGYQFITTNANFTLNGFINASNNIVNQVWLSVSNSSASSITFTWIGAPVRNFGTNTASSGPISGGKVWKGLFQLDPHGTNFIWPLMQNN